MKARFRSVLKGTGKSLAGAVLLATLILALLPASATAQQLVPNLDAHKAKLENLIEERLASLVPSRNYIVRVVVEGRRQRSPTAVTEDGIPELPGFRQSLRQTRREVVQYLVTRISVQIVISEYMRPSDSDYLRTLVPVLADFDETRGDSLDLQVITPDARLRAAEDERAEDEGAPGESPLPESLKDLSLRDWIVLGLLALVLLVLVILMFRVFFMPKPKPMPAPLAAGPDSAAAAAAQRQQAQQSQQARDDRDAEEAVVVRKDEDKVAALRPEVVKGLVGRPDLSKQLMQDWADQPGRLVALVHGLGPAVARKAMLPHLGPEQYSTIEETVRKEEEPDISAVLEAMREASFYLTTQELLQPETINSNPFAFLNTMSRGQIAFLIKDEPAKIKAMTLSWTPPADTARILEGMPKEMQLEVAVQIGNFHDLPLEAAQEVAFNLAEKARHVPDDSSMEIEGPSTLVDLIGRTSSDTIRYLLQGLKSQDRALSEEIDKLFFLFESIPMVPDAALPQAVRILPSSVVVQAMQGADNELQRKVIMAFPEQARNGLVTSLRAAQYDVETVMEARRRVVAQFQVLGRDGKIDLKQISDAWQERAQAS